MCEKSIASTGHEVQDLDIPNFVNEFNRLFEIAYKNNPAAKSMRITLILSIATDAMTPDEVLNGLKEKGGCK